MWIVNFFSPENSALHLAKANCKGYIDCIETNVWEEEERHSDLPANEGYLFSSIGGVNGIQILSHHEVKMRRHCLSFR